MVSAPRFLSLNQCLGVKATVSSAVSSAVLSAALSVTLFLSCTLAQDLVVGVSFDGGDWFDRSFNEGTWNGVKRAVDGLDDKDIDVIVYNDPTGSRFRGLDKIAETGLDIMVSAGFLQADAIAEASADFPDINFVLIDAVVENDNVRSVLFREQEGSFLVGYLAGSLTRSGVLGFVGGMDIPLIRAFDLGYQEGVLAACPDCEIRSDYIGTTAEAWNDPERAFELAEAQQANGADIIYAAAGASGNGVIDFVTSVACYTPEVGRDTPLTSILTSLAKSEVYNRSCGADSHPLFFIGVDSNQNYQGDTDNDPETLNHGLTSMLKRVDVAAFNAVNDVNGNSFTGGIQNLGLAEEGVGYALDEYNRALIPEGLVAELERIKAEIISGERPVTDYREIVGE